jgi:hypothetical protein
MQIRCHCHLLLWLLFILPGRYEVLLSYARFLHDDVGNIEEAGGHLRECIQIDSGDSRAIGFYARILHEFYKDVGLSDR